MKKYKCPYCENESFSFVQKMFAGGITSSGTACPVCGKHAVHGTASTMVSTVIMLAAFVFIIINFRSGHPDFLLSLGVFAGAFLFSRLINGLFFSLTQNIRRDIT